MLCYLAFTIGYLPGMFALVREAGLCVHYASHIICSCLPVMSHHHLAYGFYAFLGRAFLPQFASLLVITGRQL